MKKVRFAMIGGGKRSQFYMRCANALPEVFEVTHVLFRDEEKAKVYGDKFRVKTTLSFDDIVADKPDYVIVALPRSIVLPYYEKLFKANIPVFTETPPGRTTEDYIALWKMVKELNGKIQVTEQYYEWPLYGAWLKAVEKGMIGEVANISLNAIHGYHAMNIIRRFLGLTNENCTVYGKSYDVPILASQAGKESEDGSGITTMPRNKVTFEFDNGKVAFFDFAGVQYRSRIRTNKMNVQGTRGEIDDLTIRYVNENDEIIQQDLQRVDLGPYTIRHFTNTGITLGNEFLYKNIFEGQYPRLNDDELSVATIMYHMKEYVDTGIEFYKLEDALQDSYFALLIDEAVKNPLQPIKSETQVWFE